MLQVSIVALTPQVCSGWLSGHCLTDLQFQPAILQTCAVLKLSKGAKQSLLTSTTLYQAHVCLLMNGPEAWQQIMTTSMFKV